MSARMRDDFITYSVYVWGVAAIHAASHYSMLTDRSWFDSSGIKLSVNVLGVPLYLGVINILLLLYATIRFVLRRRASGSGAATDDQTSFLDRYRELMTYLNLLLLIGVTSVVEAEKEISSMKILRAVSVFIFILLKPDAPRLIAERFKKCFKLRCKVSANGAAMKWKQNSNNDNEWIQLQIR